ncbi:hypothetical protein J6TS7_66180 [Paenibacillus dendritiformis]|uniref:stalk domain-containing protein n=1 Tax=Paenibacillus TaxID=44249 RepID=UPI001B130663|nr:stalk domain-containing protein [Paenibacillus dendritiformis]MEB9897992.1 stalk domain-containing protein [Bacillus cereus]GIO83008.1 hypothetical protein J6TS7_66180 [Paenibacillus dendritiformis]
MANSRSYVVSQAPGEKVEWNNKSKTVTVKTTTGKKIDLPLGQKVAIVNSMKQFIDAPAMKISKSEFLLP